MKKKPLSNKKGPWLRVDWGVYDSTISKKDFDKFPASKKQNAKIIKEYASHEEIDREFEEANRGIDPQQISPKISPFEVAPKISPQLSPKTIKEVFEFSGKYTGSGIIDYPGRQYLSLTKPNPEDKWLRVDWGNHQSDIKEKDYFNIPKAQRLNAKIIRYYNQKLPPDKVKTIIPDSTIYTPGPGIHEPKINSQVIINQDITQPVPESNNRNLTEEVDNDVFIKYGKPGRGDIDYPLRHNLPFIDHAKDIGTYSETVKKLWVKKYINLFIDSHPMLKKIVKEKGKTLLPDIKKVFGPEFIKKLTIYAENAFSYEHGPLARHNDFTPKSRIELLERSLDVDQNNIKYNQKKIVELKRVNAYLSDPNVKTYLSKFDINPLWSNRGVPRDSIALRKQKIAELKKHYELNFDRYIKELKRIAHQKELDHVQEIADKTKAEIEQYRKDVVNYFLVDRLKLIKNPYRSDPTLATEETKIIAQIKEYTNKQYPLRNVLISKTKKYHIKTSKHDEEYTGNMVSVAERMYDYARINYHPLDVAIKDLEKYIQNNPDENALLLYDRAIDLQTRQELHRQQTIAMITAQGNSVFNVIQKKEIEEARKTYYANKKIQEKAKQERAKLLTDIEDPKRKKHLLEIINKDIIFEEGVTYEGSFYSFKQFLKKPKNELYTDKYALDKFREIQTKLLQGDPSVKFDTKVTFKSISKILHTYTTLSKLREKYPFKTDRRALLEYYAENRKYVDLKRAYDLRTPKLLNYSTPSIGNIFLGMEERASKSFMGNLDKKALQEAHLSSHLVDRFYKRIHDVNLLDSTKDTMSSIEFDKYKFAWIEARKNELLKFYDEHPDYVPPGNILAAAQADWDLSVKDAKNIGKNHLPPMPQGSGYKTPTTTGRYSRNMVMFDTETDDQGGILSVAAIKFVIDISDGKIKILDTYEHYYFPRHPERFKYSEAQAVNELTPEIIKKLRDEQKKQGIFPGSYYYTAKEQERLRRFIGNNSLILGHNIVAFDILHALGDNIPGNTVLDTLVAAENIRGKGLGLNTLDTLFKTMFGKTMEEAGLPHHQVFADAVANLLIFDMMRRFKGTLGDSIRYVLEHPKASLAPIQEFTKAVRTMVVEGGPYKNWQLSNEFYVYDSIRGTRYGMSDIDTSIDNVIDEEGNDKGNNGLNEGIDRIVDDAELQFNSASGGSGLSDEIVKQLTTTLNDIHTFLSSVNLDTTAIKGLFSVSQNQNLISLLTPLSKVVSQTDNNQLASDMLAKAGIPADRHATAIQMAQRIQAARVDTVAAWSEYGFRTGTLGSGEFKYIRDQAHKDDITELNLKVALDKERKQYSFQQQLNDDYQTGKISQDIVDKFEHARSNIQDAWQAGSMKDAKESEVMHRLDLQYEEAAKDFAEMNKGLVGATEALHGFFMSLKPTFYDIRNQVSTSENGFKSAMGAADFLPKFIKNPIMRMGDAVHRIADMRLSNFGMWMDIGKNANFSVDKMLTAGGTAVGSILGGGLGTMVAPGGGTVAGALGGATVGHMAGSAIGHLFGGGTNFVSQLWGKHAEKQMQNFWRDLQVKFDFLGTAIDIVSVPFKLLASAAKSLISMFKGLGVTLKNFIGQVMQSLGKLGNPITTLTGVNYSQYQSLGLLDNLFGLGQGSINASFEDTARQREMMYRTGQFDLNRVKASAMLGVYNEAYGNNASFENIVNKLASQNLSAAEIAQTADIDKNLPQILEAMKALGVSTWEQYKDPSHRGITFHNITDPERTHFRTAYYDYSAISENINNSKQRIGVKLWDAFGKDIYEGLNEALDSIANGGSIKDAFERIKKPFVNLWRTIAFKVTGDSDASLKKVASTIWSKINESGIFAKVGEALGGLFEPLIPAIQNGAKMIVDIWIDFLSSMYKSLRPWLNDMLNLFNNIQISPENFLWNMRNKDKDPLPWIGIYNTGSQLNSSEWLFTDINRPAVMGSIKGDFVNAKNKLAALRLGAFEYMEGATLNDSWNNMLSSIHNKNSKNIKTQVGQFLSNEGYTVSLPYIELNDGTRVIYNDNLDTMKDLNKKYNSSGYNAWIASHASGVPYKEYLTENSENVVDHVLNATAEGAYEAIDRMPELFKEGIENMKNSVTLNINGVPIGTYELPNNGNSTAMLTTENQNAVLKAYQTNSTAQHNNHRRTTRFSYGY